MTSLKWGLIANRVGGKSPNNSLGERRCHSKVTNQYPQAYRFVWASLSDRGLPDVHP